MELSSYLLSSRSKQPADISRFGGKTRGLYKLVKLGLKVPEFCGFSADFFSEIYYKDGYIESVMRSSKSIDEKHELMNTYIKEVELESRVFEALLKVFDDISQRGKEAVAVRSSLIDEDGSAGSFAGQMESFLNLRSIEGFLESVQNCALSAFAKNALVYREKIGADPVPRIAMLVQRMVNSDVSGVAFSKDTASGSSRRISVNSLFGLGEALVSGTLNSDSFVLDKRSGKTLESSIAEKEQMLVYAEGDGTIYKALPQEKKNAPSLSRDMLKALRKGVLKIEKGFKHPVDIEFAFEGKSLYILQARALTADSDERENLLVWDNSNIVESYSGVSTPMTFSFIKMAYSVVYRQFCEVLGVPEGQLKANENIFHNMLGFIKGRVYYNLINWYRVVKMLPGYSYNKGFMEEMMGLSVVRDYIKDDDEESGFLRKYFVELPKLLSMSVKMISSLLGLGKKVDDFFEKFYSRYDKLRQTDFNSLSAYKIMLLVRGLQRDILGNWKAPILNDLKAMIFYGTLKRLCANWAQDEGGTLQNDLLTGEGDIKSKAVVVGLQDLASYIRNDEVLKGLFVNKSAAELLAMLRAKSLPKGFTERFEKYLYDYGVRSIEEMKLESVPVKDDPEFCLSVIKGFVANDKMQDGESGKREQEIRTNAEEELRQRIKGFTFIFPKRAVFNFVLKHCRAAVRDRENQRFCRSEIYSVMRDALLAIGRKWESAGVLEGHRDIFYLSWDEVWNFIEGTAVSTDFKSAVRIRKEEFAEYEKLEMNDRIETCGEVYLNEQSFYNEESSSKRSFSGLGVCRGIVKGRARVLAKPDAKSLLNGEILVARQTDPGWVVLFPSISALVVEKGSMLSHSAIVAREMGIPAVVGAKGAFSSIKDGDYIKVDASNGNVIILEEGDE